MEWKSIESVEDGDSVIVYNPVRNEVIQALAWKNGSYADPVYDEWDCDGATHWMPLPEPPK